MVRPSDAALQAWALLVLPPALVCALRAHLLWHAPLQLLAMAAASAGAAPLVVKAATTAANAARAAAVTATARAPSGLAGLEQEEEMDASMRRRSSPLVGEENGFFWWASATRCSHPRRRLSDGPGAAHANLCPPRSRPRADADPSACATADLGAATVGFLGLVAAAGYGILLPSLRPFLALSAPWDAVVVTLGAAAVLVAVLGVAVGGAPNLGPLSLFSLCLATAAASFGLAAGAPGWMALLLAGGLAVGVDTLNRMPGVSPLPPTPPLPSRAHPRGPRRATCCGIWAAWAAWRSSPTLP